MIGRVTKHTKNVYGSLTQTVNVYFGNDMKVVGVRLEQRSLGKWEEIE